MISYHDAEAAAVLRGECTRLVSEGALKAPGRWVFIGAETPSLEFQVAERALKAIAARRAPGASASV